MAEQFSGTLLPQNQNVEETQKTALDLLSKINKVSQSAENALNAVKKTIPSTYTPPAWRPYPAGTYSFPSGNQAVAEGVLAIGATTTAPTKATTNTSKIWYRDWGTTIDIMFIYSHTSNAGAAAGSGDYLIPLPLGKTFDSNFVTTAANLMCTKFSTANLLMDTGTFFSAVLEPGAYNSSCLVFLTTYANSAGSANTGTWSSVNFNIAAAATRYCVSGTITGIPIQ